MEAKETGVRIVDIDMPFGSMVRFMVKWAIAAIPALIILMVIGAIVGAVLAAAVAGIAGGLTGGSSETPNIGASSVPDSLVQASTGEPSSTNGAAWLVSESTNPIDDSPVVSMSLSASSPTSTMMRDAPSLILRCKSKETDLFINWDEFLGSDEISVTTRVGKSPASKRSWSLSTDNQASFYPASPVGFIKQLLEVDTLIAVTTPYNESPITATFELKDLAEKIQPLRKACSW